MYKKLMDLTEGVYPFHMPGHKRNPAFLKECPDITEVTGADDLHHPSGMIKTAAERAARLFKVSDTLFSTAGSTPLILAAITAATKSDDKILIARNCHRSVYNAALINSLCPDYLLPEWVEELGTDGVISPLTVEEALSKVPAAAVVITSPTYDGFVSDIRTISEICHKYGATLIVDAAHGAHLGFSPDFMEGARTLGADLVIESAHKTLPCLTGAAFLHICSDKVDVQRLKSAFSIYHTSSPSYPILSSIIEVLDTLKYKGADLFKAQSYRIDDLLRATSHLRALKVLRRYDHDKSKIIISCKNADISGFELKRMLLLEHKIECEMAMPSYVLCISSIADTALGFDRLAYALSELDLKLSLAKEEKEVVRPLKPTVKLPLRAAFEAETTALPLEFSAGYISGDFVYAYPPGSPIIAPGEVITASSLAVIHGLLESGAEIHISSGDPSLIKVIKQNK